MARGEGCTAQTIAAPRGARSTAAAHASPALLPKRPAQAARLVAAAREARDLAEIAAASEQIEALGHGETLYVGGLSVYRLQADYPGSATHATNVSGGLLEWGDEGYIAHIHPGDDPVEILSAQRLNPLWRARHERNMRLLFEHSMPGIRKDAPVWAHIEAAVTANTANGRYQSFRAAFPELDELIVAVYSDSKDPGIVMLAQDVLNHASWQGTFTALNSEVIKVTLQLKEKGRSYFADYSPTGNAAPSPGVNSNDCGGTAATLRHEYAHGVWERLDPAEQDAFIDLLPVDEQDIHDGLTHYASLVGIREIEPKKEAHYGGGVRGGYRTETFAELVATVTHPGFDRTCFPDWVGGCADWLDALVERRLGTLAAAL